MQKSENHLTHYKWEWEKFRQRSVFMIVSNSVLIILFIMYITSAKRVILISIVGFCITTICIVLLNITSKWIEVLKKIIFHLAVMMGVLDIDRMSNFRDTQKKNDPSELDLNPPRIKVKKRIGTIGIVLLVLWMLGLFYGMFLAVFN